ncbi:MAG: molybdopterin-synthase adenylyltransferase MoeB [Trueperaceae bacterium]|nr:molybdopterin-synthase adenylyltransferase MoeB [Trueperaceae bacterium]
MLIPMFSKEQLDRYSRHIILKGVGAAGQKRLLDAKILVIGAGGLGSPLLMYLAAAGVGTLGIVDFDRVDLSNLQRQTLHSSARIGMLKTDSARESLLAINPEIQLELYPSQLSSENARTILRDYDLVIDGSDNFPTRYLVNDATFFEKKPLLYGAISQFEGQLSLFNWSLEGVQGPCYRCLFPKPPKPGTIPSCAEAGVFGALPGVIGSMMAVEAIKHVLELGKSLAGVMLHYDSLYQEMRRVKLRQNPGCELCGKEASLTELIDYDFFCS